MSEDRRTQIRSVFGLLLCITIAILEVGCKLGSFADLNTNGNTNGNSNGNGNSNSSLVFSTPEDVSNSHSNLRSAWPIESNVILDDVGSLHVLYEETDSIGSDRQIKYVTKTSGGSWSTPVQLSAAASSMGSIASFSARMDVHPTNGHVYAVWTRASLSSAVYMVHNRSGSFTAETQISDTNTPPNLNFAPGVRVDGGDNAHFVWTGQPSGRNVVYYRGLFDGTLDTAQTAVSSLTEDSWIEPSGLAVIPPADGAQVVSVAYVGSTPVHLWYAERPAGKGQSFGTPIDISKDSQSTHELGSIDASPRLLFDGTGDLRVLWTHMYASGSVSADIWGNPRAASGSFKDTSDNLTRASQGSSSSVTAPIDLGGRLAVDSSGCLHLFWEYNPGTGTDEYYHRYFSPIAVDPSTVVSALLGTTTTLFQTHGIRTALDSFDALHVAWEQEDSNAARTIYYQKRSAGSGGSFESSATQLSVTSLDSALKSAAASGGGRFFAIFDKGDVPNAHVVTREVNGSVRGPLNLSESIGAQSQGLIVRVDSAGTAHVLWISTFNSTQRDIYYSSGT